jgi:hypothetical protein
MLRGTIAYLLWTLMSSGGSTSRDRVDAAHRARRTPVLRFHADAQAVFGEPPKTARETRDACAPNHYAIVTTAALSLKGSRGESPAE